MNTDTGVSVSPAKAGSKDPAAVRRRPLSVRDMPCPLLSQDASRATLFAGLADVVTSDIGTRGREYSMGS